MGGTRRTSALPGAPIGVSVAVVRPVVCPQGDAVLTWEGDGTPARHFAIGDVAKYMQSKAEAQPVMSGGGHTQLHISRLACALPQYSTQRTAPLQQDRRRCAMHLVNVGDARHGRSDSEPQRNPSV